MICPLPSRLDLLPTFGGESGRAYRAMILGLARLPAKPFDGPSLCLSGNQDRIIARGMSAAIARRHRAEHVAFDRGHWLIAPSAADEVAGRALRWLGGALGERGPSAIRSRRSPRRRQAARRPSCSPTSGPRSACAWSTSCGAISPRSTMRLPWAWQAVKPLYLHGMADRAVVDFRRDMTVPKLGSLAGSEPASVDAVLASYDHSNTVNLFALGRPGSAAARRRGGRRHAGAGAAPAGARRRPAAARFRSRCVAGDLAARAAAQPLRRPAGAPDPGQHVSPSRRMRRPSCSAWKRR